MNKFLIWGTGVRASSSLDLYKKIDCVAENQIIGFVDNDPQKWGSSFQGYDIYSPNEMDKIEFDYICIWVQFGEEIRKQIVEELKISENRIKDIFMPYKHRIFDKYKDVNDDAMQELIRKMRKDPFLKVYYYDKNDKKNILHKAYYDNDADLYYIYFESKKMYLARSYQSFIERGDKKYIGNIWGEQDLNSPHLYESGDIVVKQGDVLIDAGACEGNFALHHIDKVKKVYLIECDKEWLEALHYTFFPYQDKVVFCDKFLSDKNSQSTINLNTLVSEPVDFIKMDIEGAEVAALNGADEVFKSSQNIRCAICSYHRHEDEKEIIKILESYGLKTETSKGYMLFLYDSYVLANPELRRGIVRGKYIKNKEA